MRRATLIAGCGLVLAWHAAHADTASVSYSTWIVSGQNVTLRYVLPIAEAQRLTGVEVPVLTVSKLGDYVLRHEAVQAGGQDCPAIDQGYDLGKVDPLEVGPGLYGFEIFFRCPETPDALTLSNGALFAQVPTHVDFARIEQGGRFVERLFTVSRQRLRVPEIGPLPAEGLGPYLRLGLAHTLGSPERVCLLLAVLLLVRRGRDLASTLAALAAGYGVSLLAQATGLILARVTAIDAFVGLLIALLAALLARRATQAPVRAVVTVGWPALLLLLALLAALWHARQPALLLLAGALLSVGLLAASSEVDARGWAVHELLPVGLFGFLDGFVLPAMLAPLELAPRAQVPLVFGYDAGAWLAAALVVTLPAAAFVLLQRRQLAPPRSLVNDLGTACLGGIGTFWLLSRLHS